MIADVTTADASTRKAAAEDAEYTPLPFHGAWFSRRVRTVYGSKSCSSAVSVHAARQLENGLRRDTPGRRDGPREAREVRPRCIAPRFRARRSFLLEVDDVPAQAAIWAAANDADNANRLRFIEAVALQMFGECRRQGVDVDHLAALVRQQADVDAGIV